MPPIFSRQGFIKFAKNTLWMGSDQALRLVLGFFTTVLIVRCLQPEKFGSFSSAKSLILIFTAVSAFGLDRVAVLNFVQKRMPNQALLSTFFTLRVIGACLAWLGIAIYLAFQTSSSLSLLIILMMPAYLFQALDVIDYFFQAQVQAKYTALARSVAFVLATLLRLYGVFYYPKVTFFAVAFTLEYVFAGACLVYLYRRQGHELKLLSGVSRGAVKEIFQQCWPLYLATISVMIYMYCDQIILQLRWGSSAVGIYAAAVQVSGIFCYIAMVLVLSLFPAIAADHQLPLEMRKRRFIAFMSLLLWLAILISTIITLTAPWLVQVLFGETYKATTALIQGHIWSTVFIFQNVLAAQWLLKEGFARLYGYFSLIAALCNLILNLLWVSSMGAIGAVYATLIAYGLASFLLPALLKRTRPLFIYTLEALWLPFKVGFAGTSGDKTFPHRPDDQ